MDIKIAGKGKTITNKLTMNNNFYFFLTISFKIYVVFVYIGWDDSQLESVISRMINRKRENN